MSDNLLPRLRYAYGTLGGLLAGQATSNFSDPDANAEVLDFGGNVGEPGHVRIPQIRYTMPVWGGGSFSVSAETPETDVGTPQGLIASDSGVIPTVGTSCTGTTTVVAGCSLSSSLFTSGQLPLNPAKSTAPDVTFAYYLPQAWGHLDFSAVIRPGLDVEDGRFISQAFIGFGGHFGADFKPGWFGWAKDDFTVHVVGGQALGGYLNSSTNFALATNFGTTGGYGSFTGPTTLAAASAIIVKPTDEFGAEIGYQHWWADNLRSNFNGGFNAHQIPANLVGATQAAAMNKELISAHTNIIWSPVSSVDIGLEYTWGQRTVVTNAHAPQIVLICKLASRLHPRSTIATRQTRRLCRRVFACADEVLRFRPNMARRTAAVYTTGVGQVDQHEVVSGAARRRPPCEPPMTARVKLATRLSAKRR